MLLEVAVFVELAVQREKCTASSAKDKCDTRSFTAISEIGALIALAASYQNREHGAREGAIHPKIASLTASLRWGVTAASLRSWSRWYSPENFGEHNSEFLDSKRAM